MLQKGKKRDRASGPIITPVRPNDCKPPLAEKTEGENGG